MLFQVGSASENNIKNKFMQFLDKNKICQAVSNDLSIVQGKPCYCKISVLEVFLSSEISLFFCCSCFMGLGFFIRQKSGLSVLASYCLDYLHSSLS